MEALAFSRKLAEPMAKTQQDVTSSRMRVDAASNPWSGYTGSFQEEKAGLKVESSAMDPTWARLDALASYAIEGDPLIAIDRKGRTVYLSAKHFSGVFERIDATRLGSGVRKVCGAVKVSSSLLANPGRLVRFLLQAHLIRTYMHLESSLELIFEGTSDEGRFTSKWVGKHVFYTNEKNESSLQFTVIVDTKTGLVEVAGD